MSLSPIESTREQLSRLLSPLLLSPHRKIKFFKKQYNQSGRLFIVKMSLVFFLKYFINVINDIQIVVSNKLLYLMQAYLLACLNKIERYDFPKMLKVVLLLSFEQFNPNAWIQLLWHRLDSGRWNSRRKVKAGRRVEFLCSVRNCFFNFIYWVNKFVGDSPNENKISRFIAHMVKEYN